MTGASRQDYTDDRRVAERELVVGNNLAIHVQFAHAASDKLRGLRAEIENNNLFLHIQFCINLKDSAKVLI